MRYPVGWDGKQREMDEWYFAGSRQNVDDGISLMPKTRCIRFGTEWARERESDSWVRGASSECQMNREAATPGQERFYHSIPFLFTLSLFLTSLCINGCALGCTVHSLTFVALPRRMGWGMWNRYRKDAWQTAVMEFSLSSSTFLPMSSIYWQVDFRSYPPGDITSRFSFIFPPVACFCAPRAYKISTNNDNYYNRNRVASKNWLSRSSKIKGKSLCNNLRDCVNWHKAMDIFPVFQCKTHCRYETSNINYKKKLVLDRFIFSFKPKIVYSGISLKIE